LAIGLLAYSLLAMGQCDAPQLNGPRQIIDTWRVVDGDTLHIDADQRLRLAMVNTPELGRNSLPDQPLARAAKQAVIAFMQASREVFWQVGLDQRQQPARDHYGRWLGQIYNAQGDWLAAHLVAQGLAFVISVSPRAAPACLWQLEAQARAAGVGIWSSALGHPVAAARIEPPVGGFMLLDGEVIKVSHSQRDWYVELDGDVVLRINKKRWAGASGGTPETWLHQQVQARGWLIWRKLSAKQRQRGFKAGLMNISHPHMLVHQAR
jgi:endonuclease YncB( thermonuclease family)